MNPALTIGNSHSIFDYIYRETRNGAVKGALAGVSFVSATAATGVFHGILERGSRVIGNEPKWPIFEEDCQLEQFRNLSTCANPSLSFTSFTAYVVGTTTLCGMAIGAISAAKNVFAKSQ